jgi:hypothetical protein
VVIISVCVCVCWVLWLNRNDRVFHNNIVSSLGAILFRLISFPQHWMVASSEDDKGRVGVDG